MIRSLFWVSAVSLLAACQPTIPDSNFDVVNKGRGVGFDNDLGSQRARDVLLSQSGPVSVAPTQDIRPAPQQTVLPPAQQSASTPPAATGGQSADLQQIARSNDAASAAQNSGEAVVNASPSNPAPTILNNPGISDENDFGAVSARRSIEGDAQNIARNRQQYAVIRPTELPRRTGTNQPNIVAYALRTQHPVGTRLYRRTGLNQAAKFQRNCAAFASDDLAQIEFLQTGGPQRDRASLDPDGDGYACGWDPTPFRRSSQG